MVERKDCAEPRVDSGERAGRRRPRGRAAFALPSLLLVGMASMAACAVDPPAPIGEPSNPDAATPPEADAGVVTPAKGSVRVIAGASLRTGEDGARVTFSVALGSRPSAAVIVPLASSDEREVTVGASSLSFSPDDWDTPKTVTLTGEDDDVADGDQQVAIRVGPAVSSDAIYNGLSGEPVKVTNADNDTSGFEITAPSPSANTTELGGQVRFSVRLRSKPAADVTLGVASSKPSEGIADKASLVFSPTNWNQPQTVTVTGKDDAVADGDQPYVITLAKAVSSDPAYAAIDPADVALVNQDDDSPGLFVSAPAPSAQTTESGGAVSFTVRLRSRPTQDVTIPVSSTRPAEGRPSVAALTFTPATYDQPQTVTVTGQDDDVDDDDQAYTVVLGAATSLDPGYAGLDAPDVALTNKDDDTAAVLVSAPAPAAQTTEAGGQVTFTVRLASAPTADVTVGVSSSKPSEGQVDVAQLVFTAANWSVAQTLTVTGQDDAVDDGNVSYAIVLARATSADPRYAAIDAADVALTNVDDDTAGLVVSAPDPDNRTTEAGGQITFTVQLQSRPLANVTLPVGSTAPTEGRATPTSLLFTTANWSVAQTVTVVGQDDGVGDGEKNYAATLGASASADPLYANLTASVALVNVDLCGNGGIDPGEQCEDGNVAKCDGCESCERRSWMTLPARASATVAGIAAALPRGSMCVEAWAQVGAVGDAVIASSYGAGNNGAFILRCGAGRLAFANEAGGPVVEAAAAGTACGDGQWHHFAGCRSVVGATLTNTVFLDGQLRATASGSAATLGANAALVLGGLTYGADGLAGAIDEVRISSTLRYAGAFVPARRLAADAATVGLWHLDEGTGTTFADASGNGYTGAVGGGGWAVDTGYSAAVCR